MARKSGRYKSNRMKRDLKMVTSYPPLLHRPVISPLMVIEDRRILKPINRLLQSSLRNLSAAPISHTKSHYKAPRPFYMPRSFDSLPRDAVICARRKIRKEVIFALGSGGRRGSKKPYRRSSTSNIHCRRK